MNRLLLSLTIIIGLAQSPVAMGYIEVPYTLGKIVEDAAHVVHMEVARVNKEKGLIIFRKLKDLKGEWPEAELKHNIGMRGFHEREWQRVMAWAAEKKQAVFFCQGDASETCIDGYWYQCYREEAWWGLSHAEPYLLRSFSGDPGQLAEHVAAIVRGDQVTVTCLADGDREQLMLGEGKLQRLRASNTRLDYNPRRDFAGWGALGPETEEFAFEPIFPAGSPGWKYLASSRMKIDTWMTEGYRDRWWQNAKTPLGYGEPAIQERGGTRIAIRGQDVLIRRTIDIPEEVLKKEGVSIALSVASDNNATLYFNGELLHEEPEADHEFAYWNHEVPIPVDRLKPGANLLAARVHNAPASSDLFFDVELFAMYAVKKDGASVPPAVAGTTPVHEPSAIKPEEKAEVSTLEIDEDQRTVALGCWIAPRKLPHLEDKYPIEVIATWPHPRGQKAHETVVVFRGIKPSDVHAALVKLGLKPGQPALGEGAAAKGPEVEVLLELTNEDGSSRRLPLEKCLVLRDSGEAPKPLKWFFTGSAMKQPDPEREHRVYGADLTGTLLSLFPVTDSCVLQSQLTMADEPHFRLETNPAVLPPSGTAARLILKVKSP